MSHAAPTTVRRRYVTGLPGRRDAARYRAVIAALDDLHAPFAIHDECACPYDEDTGETIHTGETVTDCWDFETCSPPRYFICTACCTRDDEQHGECGHHHDHGPGKPACPTRAIIDGDTR